MNKEVVRNETLQLMLLIDAGNVVQRAVDKRLSELDLSTAQLRILSHVYFAEDQLTPGLLGALLLQVPHSISGLLNRLEDRGLITRRHDTRDRRVVWIGLTDEGRRVTEQATGIMLQAAGELDAPLRGAKGTEALRSFSDLRDHGMSLAGLRADLRARALDLTSV